MRPAATGWMSHEMHQKQMCLLSRVMDNRSLTRRLWRLLKPYLTVVLPWLVAQRGTLISARTRTLERPFMIFTFVIPLPGKASHMRRPSTCGS